MMVMVMVMMICIILNNSFTGYEQFLEVVQ